MVAANCVALVAVGWPQLQKLVRGGFGVTVQPLDAAIQTGQADVVEAGDGEAAVLLRIHKRLLLPPHEDIWMICQLAAPAEQTNGSVQSCGMQA